MPAAERRASEPSPRPSGACTIIDAGDGRSGPGIDRLAAAVRSALEARDAPVVLLCARGEPLQAAREEVRLLHEALQAALRAAFGSTVLRTSRSATAGLAALAFGNGAPIGVDVQSAPSALDEDVLGAALDAVERQWLGQQAAPHIAFARLWAAKEAVLKAFGVGLAWSPRKVGALPVTEAWRSIDAGPLGCAWLSHIEVRGTPFVGLAVAQNAGQYAGQNAPDIGPARKASNYRR